MHARTDAPGTMGAPLRGIIAVFISLAVTLGFAPAPAMAVDPAYRGLFGPQDPTYDGVDRQATAILGLVAVDAQVPPLAVRWLLRQQCADGSFSAFRADTSRPCTAPDLTNATGPNTNSTALAAMALSALADQEASGNRTARQAARKAVTWLLAQQQADGGWEWLAGLGSDSVSTAMTLAAIDRRTSASHQRGLAYLKTTMQTDSGCWIAFMPDSTTIDPLSTSWTFIATQGSLPYARVQGPRNLTPCDASQPNVLASGSWLASELTEGSGEIPSTFEPGETDWNATALATLGLTQRHGSTREMRLGLSALKVNVSSYVEKDDVDRAAPLGTLLMIAHATKSDPRNFGGVNLTRSLPVLLQK